MKRDSMPFRTRFTLGASAAVAAMTAMAIYNIYHTKKAEREHPPRGRFVTVDGVRLHYLEAGNGAPVVLLHGNVVSAEDFELSGVLPLLAQGKRVIAFDRPGFGYSDRPYGAIWTPTAQADLLRHALAALGIERPVVLGHSWGAMVALSLALNHPNSVRGIVLLSGYYHPTPRTDVLLSWPPAIPVIGDLLRFTVSPLFAAPMLPRLLKKMFAPLPVPKNFAGHFDGLPIRPGQIRAESQDGVTMVPAASALRSRYHQLSLPVVIMAGAEDQVVDAERHAVRLHRQIPHSRLRLVADAGHMLHYAVPEEVAEAVRAAAERPVSAAEAPAPA